MRLIRFFVRILSYVQKLSPTLQELTRWLKKGLYRVWHLRRTIKDPDNRDRWKPRIIELRLIEATNCTWTLSAEGNAVTLICCKNRQEKYEVDTIVSDEVRVSEKKERERVRFTRQVCTAARKMLYYFTYCTVHKAIFLVILFRSIGEASCTRLDCFFAGAKELHGISTNGIIGSKEEGEDRNSARNSRNGEGRLAGALKEKRRRERVFLESSANPGHREPARISLAPFKSQYSSPICETSVVPPSVAELSGVGLRPIGTRSRDPGDVAWPSDKGSSFAI